MKLHPSRFLNECPLCKASFTEGAFAIIEDKKQNQLYHCTCPQCGRGILTYITNSHGWISTVGLVTDLTAEDALRLKHFEAITTDDCLEIYTLLHEYSKDLCQKLLA